MNPIYLGDTSILTLDYADCKNLEKFSICGIWKSTSWYIGFS